jgi:DNA-binding MarR family transcriptional regulator
VRARRRNVVLDSVLLFRKLHPEITLNGIVAFLYIAENPGINIVELSQICGFNMPTASRVARALGPVDVEGSLPPYLGLVDIFLNPTDPRGRVLSISERGRALCAKLDALIGEGIAISPPDPHARVGKD